MELFVMASFVSHVTSYLGPEKTHDLCYSPLSWDPPPCKSTDPKLFTRHNNPDDSSEHHTRRRENLKSPNG
jgi:hypothetical protein